MKIAIISDIHGNSWALSAVLLDIKKRKPDLIVNLGDSLYGPLDPKGTLDLFISQEIISISGNEDRIIVENINKDKSNATLKFVINQLDHNAIEWLRNLKNTKILDGGVFICHGTPHADHVYLLEDIKENYIQIKENQQLKELLKGINQKIILCGHSHIPRIVDIKQHIIINPGSVGLPAYDDNIPMFHKIENYNPNAQYCLLEFTNSLFQVEQISISYDYEKAASCAELNNRPDWAKWIRTGRA
jgi:putative phosphoesterase